MITPPEMKSQSFSLLSICKTCVNLEIEKRKTQPNVVKENFLSKLCEKKPFTFQIESKKNTLIH